MSDSTLLDRTPLSFKDLMRSIWAHTVMRRALIAVGAVALFALIFFGFQSLQLPSLGTGGSQRLGVIDLQTVVAAKEKEFTELLLKKDATEQDRVKATELVLQFGTDTENAIKALQSQCECTLLVANSIIARHPSMQDYTLELRQLLKMPASPVSSSKSSLEGAKK